jgi:hypothetical protein
VIAEHVPELEEDRARNLSTLSYALSPSLTNISTTSVKMSVMDCSDYSTPGEMLAEAIEYPCAFVNMEGCNGKVCHISVCVCALMYVYMCMIRCVYESMYV